MYTSGKKYFQQSTLTDNTAQIINPLSRSIISQRQYLNNTKTFLQYRTNKPNLNVKISSKQKTVFPSIFCSFLGIDDKNKTNRSIHCQCPKTQDKLCKLVMGWVEQEYDWKTDPQFHKIYQSYNRKKLNQTDYMSMVLNLQKILDILGMELDKQWFSFIIEVLSNYCKHTQYYNKYSKLVAESDIYIWVCLGITYHLCFNQQITDEKKSLVFWATDICMNNFENLTVYAMQNHHSKIVKMLEGYYSSWLKSMQVRGINIKDISWQWLNQMMFGYMGIETIGFFLDCFQKAGWQYLYKLILSYFEQRTISIGKNPNFCTNSLTKEQVIKLIIDTKEQWPVIFCSASTFSVIQ